MRKAKKKVLVQSSVNEVAQINKAAPLRFKSIKDTVVDGNCGPQAVKQLLLNSIGNFPSKQGWVVYENTDLDMIRADICLVAQEYMKLGILLEDKARNVQQADEETITRYDYSDIFISYKNIFNGDIAFFKTELVALVRHRIGIKDLNEEVKNRYTYLVNTMLKDLESFEQILLFSPIFQNDIANILETLAFDVRDALKLHGIECAHGLTQEVIQYYVNEVSINKLKWFTGYELIAYLHYHGFIDNMSKTTREGTFIGYKHYETDQVIWLYNNKKDIIEFGTHWIALEAMDTISPQELDKREMILIAPDKDTSTLVDQAQQVAKKEVATAQVAIKQAATGEASTAHVAIKQAAAAHVAIAQAATKQPATKQEAVHLTQAKQAQAYSGWSADNFYYERGCELIEESKYEEAIGFFDKAIERAIKLNLKYDMACYRKGVALARLQRLEEALDCYDKVTKLNPTACYGYWAKGVILLVIGRLEEGFAYYDKVINADPNFDWAHYEKGYGLVRVGKYEEALDCYDKVIELNPTARYGHMAKGEILLVIGRLEEALACYDKVIQLDCTPEEKRYYYALQGDNLGILGKVKEAIIRYDKAIASHNNSDVLKKIINLICHYNVVLEATDASFDQIISNYCNKGISYYDQKISDCDFWPNNSLYYRDKGILFETIGKYDKAVFCYDKAMKICTQGVKEYANNALTYKNHITVIIGLKKAALEKSGQDMKIYSFNEKAIGYYNEGDMYLDSILDKRREDIEKYDMKLKWQRWEGKDTNALLLRISREIEQTYQWYYANHYQNIIELYNKAIAITPNYADALYKKGVVLEYLRKYREAVTCYDKVTDLKPNDPIAWNNKGFALEHIGERNKALACYQTAIELSPNDPIAWNNKGFAFEHIGRDNEAMACYNEAMKRKPNDPLAYSHMNSMLLRTTPVVNRKYNSPNELAEDLIDEAYELYADCDYHHPSKVARRKIIKAVNYCNQAIKLNPKDAVAHFNKGYAYLIACTYDSDQLTFFASSFKEAENLLFYATRLDPENAVVQCKMAHALAFLLNPFNERSKMTEALRYCDRAIKLNPNYSIPYYEKRNLLVKMEDDDLRALGSPLPVANRDLQEMAKVNKYTIARYKEEVAYISRYAYEPLQMSFIPIQIPNKGSAVKSSQQDKLNAEHVPLQIASDKGSVMKSSQQDKLELAEISNSTSRQPKKLGAEAASGNCGPQAVKQLLLQYYGSFQTQKELNINDNKDPRDLGDIRADIVMNACIYMRLQQKLDDLAKALKSDNGVDTNQEVLQSYDFGDIFALYQAMFNNNIDFFKAKINCLIAERLQYDELDISLRTRLNHLKLTLLSSIKEWDAIASLSNNELNDIVNMLQNSCFCVVDVLDAHHIQYDTDGDGAAILTENVIKAYLAKVSSNETQSWLTSDELIAYLHKYGFINPVKADQPGRVIIKFEHYATEREIFLNNDLGGSGNNPNSARASGFHWTALEDGESLFPTLEESSLSDSKRDSDRAGLNEDLEVGSNNMHTEGQQDELSLAHEQESNLSVINGDAESELNSTFTMGQETEGEGGVDNDLRILDDEAALKPLVGDDSY